uniref:Uncharacterized protein n=1 Tax=Bicosoecida sp. CB-2014 TaxID=1486930 RepID=A0A7S1G5H9_9STRA
MAALRRNVRVDGVARNACLLLIHLAGGDARSNPARVDNIRAIKEARARMVLSMLVDTAADPETVRYAKLAQCALGLRHVREGSAEFAELYEGMPERAASPVTYK